MTEAEVTAETPAAPAETPSAIPDMGLLPAGPDRSVVDPPRGVFDLLPWRRLGDFDPEIGPVIRLVKHHHPRADVRPIAQAYSMARDAHDGQLRKSGDPYVTHPIAVAGILADLGMDVTTVTAALLHDVVEDTSITLDDVRNGFGDEIAAIVDGVTKLDRIHFETKEAHQAATMRKMLVAMAKDIRVLLIKLADRLHNMRTLQPLPEPKQRRIAQETLDIYAPLAHRLGIREIRWQLEDLAFQVLQPKTCREIEDLVRIRHQEREHDLQLVILELQRQLDAARVRAGVTGRPKHYYSIYEKMVIGQRSFDEIYDLIGVRIVVESTRDCYAALGVVHALWKPVVGRFKDFIAMPKFNLYQSLHTTVVGPHGKPIEIQIRTQTMHRTAEYGIAAHWRYKEGQRGTHAHGDELAWIGRMMDSQEGTEDPGEFMDNLKVDLRDEIFVFTPKGDVVTLGGGSTPIDFAYSVHTEIGHHCIGSRVNGRLVPLDTRLASGDTVEIFTSKQDAAGPSRDWLQIVATPRARNKIRSWFSRERREEAVEKGKDRLKRSLRRSKLAADKLMSSSELEQVAEEMNYQYVASLFAAIGESHVRADVVVQHLVRVLQPEVAASPVEEPQVVTGRRSKSARQVGVHVEGFDDMLVKLARCCNPLPGNDIIGYVTRGRGVSVHRADCANAMALSNEPERLIEVEWDSASHASALASIQVEALDRSGLLADVTRVLSDHHVNIRAAQTATGKDQIALLRFEFELGDASQLDAVLRGIGRLDAVYEVFRVVPGGDDGRH